MENFEAYFKKQQADSNCGFAEEYEVCAYNLCFLPVCLRVKLWVRGSLEGREDCVWPFRDHCCWPGSLQAPLFLVEVVFNLVET